jgi:hypothetical protein
MVANYRQGSGILMAVSGYIFAVTKKASLNNNYIDRVKHYVKGYMFAVNGDICCGKGLHVCGKMATYVGNGYLFCEFDMFRIKHRV